MTWHFRQLLLAEQRSPHPPGGIPCLTLMRFAVPFAPNTLAATSGRAAVGNALSDSTSAHYLRTQLGTFARIWSANVLSASPMSKPCASKSITTLALATMARLLLKPGRLPCNEF